MLITNQIDQRQAPKIFNKIELPKMYNKNQEKLAHAKNKN